MLHAYRRYLLLTALLAGLLGVVPFSPYADGAGTRIDRDGKSGTRSIRLYAELCDRQGPVYDPGCA
jgi:hypothetical protein